MNNLKYTKLDLSKCIKLSWGSLMVFFLLMIVFRSPDTNDDILVSILMLCHVVITMILFGASTSRYGKYFFWAFFLRFIVLSVDLYMRDYISVPHSGADSEFFYGGAEIVSRNLNLIIDSKGERIGLYHKILGLFMWLVGSHRIVIQYINLMAGIMVVYTIYNTLNLLQIDERRKKEIILIVSFFPTSLIMSGILLREILPTWFIAVSLYYFVRWFVLTQSRKDILLSFVMVGAASVFHSGVIGVFFGYAFAMLFYNQQLNKLIFTGKTIFSFIFLFAFLGVFLMMFGDAILYKFSKVGESDDIFDNIISAAGGSAYLSGLTINNPLQMILYGPIRAVYFLFSPMPWNWRGGIDLFTFFTDSILYLIVIYSIYKNRKSLNSKQGKLVLILLISIIVTSFIFGLGVSNAGTALRHRQKIAPLFFMILGVIMQERGKHTKNNYL